VKAVAKAIARRSAASRSPKHMVPEIVEEIELRVRDTQRLDRCALKQFFKRFNDKKRFDFAQEVVKYDTIPFRKSRRTTQNGFLSNSFPESLGGVMGETFTDATPLSLN